MRTLHNSDGSQLRFGIQQSRFQFGSSSDDAWKAFRLIAARAESTGFDMFFLRDHMMQAPPAEDPSDPVLEGWVALSALADSTHSIKLGQLTTCNGFRNPYLLAKMAASLDLISGGRLILGIGAGSFEQEHISCGFHWGTPGERIRRMEEAVKMIRMLWSNDRVTFHGEFYNLKEAICNPKPKQKQPPILVAGMGEKLTLKVAARHADMCNIPTRDPAKLQQAVDILRYHCEKFGRSMGDIEVTCLTQVLIGEDSSQVREKLEMYKPKQISNEEYLRRTIVGTVDECIDGILEIQKAGASCFIANFPDADDPNTFRLFCNVIRSISK